MDRTLVAKYNFLVQLQLVFHSAPLGVSAAFGQDCGDLFLHEGPRSVGSYERTLVPARTEELSIINVLLFGDGVSGAREAELVLCCGGTLHKMGVIQLLCTDRAQK